MDVVYSQHSSYLTSAFADIDRIVLKAERQLADVEFDTFVGTGLSGALVIPTVARAMNKFFAIVRKDNDSEHCSYDIEGKIGKRWVFLDDLIASGETRRRVIQVVEHAVIRYWNTVTGRADTYRLGDRTEFVGSFLYYHDSYTTYKPTDDDWTEPLDFHLD